MSYRYQLTTAKTMGYLQNELNFIKKNYGFLNSIWRTLSFTKVAVGQAKCES